MLEENNIYGLSTSGTNADSHMLTNMEWGAITYLTHSKYGRCPNGSCTRVTINNCQSYVTGIGGDSISAGKSSTSCVTAANQYDGVYGKLASTTGNITGVYDMSGGAWEYVMGSMSKVTTGYTFSPSNTGFASNWFTNDTSKYLTTYAKDTVSSGQQSYNRSRLGDATAEALLSATSDGGWYSNYASFPYSSTTWFFRGGSYNNSSNAGLFYFYYHTGSGAHSYYSFRSSLVSIPS